jgi:hypothetical protein
MNDSEFMSQLNCMEEILNRRKIIVILKEWQDFNLRLRIIFPKFVRFSKVLTHFSDERLMKLNLNLIEIN